jgi:geranylgeranyl diphosphate synthase, type III
MIIIWYKKLLEPYDYICKTPGKHIRTKLIQCFNYWLRIPQDKLDSVSEIIELLHNSSLLIDDIEDNSTLRRGLPAAHTIYGIATTINSANYAYFIALERTLQLNHELATKVYTEQLLELHRGQGMDIWFRDNYICPDESEYQTLVIKSKP